MTSRLERIKRLVLAFVDGRLQRQVRAPGCPSNSEDGPMRRRQVGLDSSSSILICAGAGRRRQTRDPLSPEQQPN
ncbi:hypothetical protein VZT92_012404 [Zoarces viviparus]|uniref:Uncharacterized protein n=1 Tax=Zoarces viviparus TaxID=48416 RepID=A0AAW1F7L7_ZOAVI